MNSDFTSETTVRNIEIPSSIFVILVAARWMFAYALAFNTCSEATNIGYFILWELSLEVEEQSEFMFWWNLREISDSYGLNKFVNTLLLIEKSRGHNYTIMALGQVSIL